MVTDINEHRGTLSIISNALPTLKGTTEKVGRFILNYPKETINHTITELAERIGVSEASIVRFAQALSFSGFHALKISLAEDIVSPMSIVHEDLKPEDDPATAIQKVLTLGLRSLEDTVNILDLSVLEDTVQLLCNSRQIVLFAAGNAIPIAMDLDFRLTKIGLLSRFAIEPTMQAMYASLVTPEDVAIGISRTGSSKDTVHALKLAKEQGAKTVCLTNHSASPLTRHSDYCLITAMRISQFREEQLDSHLAMLALAEALFVGICIERSDAMVQAVSKTSRATNHRKY